MDFSLITGKSNDKDEISSSPGVPKPSCQGWDADGVRRDRSQGPSQEGHDMPGFPDFVTLGPTKLSLFASSLFPPSLPSKEASHTVVP